MRLGLLLASLFLASCGVTGASDPANSQAANDSVAVPSSIQSKQEAQDVWAKDITTKIAELDSKVEKLRASYRAQASIKLDAVDTESDYKNRLYAAGGAGMALRLRDEEEIRLIHLSRLEAEKFLLEENQKLKKISIQLLEAIRAGHGKAEVDLLVQRFESSREELDKYIENHRNITFQKPRETSYNEYARNTDNSDADIQAAFDRVREASDRLKAMTSNSNETADDAQ